MTKHSNPDSSKPFADFQQIDESGDIFKQIFKYSIIPTIIHDMEMNIINANDSAVEEFGYSREELLSKSIFDLHPEEKLDQSSAVLNEMQSRDKMSVETSFRRKDGSVFPAQATPCKYLVGDQPVIHVFIQDITELKLAMQKMQDFNAELESQVVARTREIEHKNRELEQFAYMASHDLQEPLRAISGFTELFTRNYGRDLDETGKQGLQYITDAAARMRTLIQDLLDYSQIGKKQEKKLVDCNELLEDAKSNLLVLIEESGARIKADRLPTIRALETETRSLFQNLLANAVKFHKPGVTPEVHVSVSEQDDFWQFSITDNGIGMKESYVKKIFLPFQRLHSRTEYEGTGIGLARCLKIVELHGGNIWARSEPGEGSTFYFTLPKQEVEPETETQAPS